MDKKGTQTNGPKKKEIDDDAQEKDKKWHKQTIYVSGKEKKEDSPGLKIS